MRKRLVELFLVALIAVGLSLAAIQGMASFATITSGQVKNAGLTTFFQEVRGFKLIYAIAGTATVGSPTVATTMTGMEVGDVIIDIVNLGADASTISSTNLANVSEGIYTVAAGEAYLNTSTGAPTVGDNLMVLFVDIDNTN